MLCICSEVVVKSALFARFDPDNKDGEEFGRDLRSVLDLGHEVPAFVATGWVELETLPVAERQAAAQRVQSQLGVAPHDLEKVLKVARFFLRALGRPDARSDTPQDWVEDLTALRVLDAAAAPHALQLFNGVMAAVGPSRRRATHQAPSDL